MKYSYLIAGALIIGVGIGAYLVLSTPHVEAPFSHEEGDDKDVSALPIVPSVKSPDTGILDNEVPGQTPGSSGGSSGGYGGSDGGSYTPPYRAPEPEPYPGPVACTMDAKICPDGSAVGRVGPNCEFAACPGTQNENIGAEHICTMFEKGQLACTMEYRPVCGLTQVQCVTTPCEPIYQTYGNGCSACSQGAVISYTEGECAL